MWVLELIPNVFPLLMVMCLTQIERKFPGEGSAIHSVSAMPLDPVTALSLASNVIQFVDFGSKLLSKTRELHKSTTGALSEDIELEIITDDLKVLSSQLQFPQSSQVYGHDLDESENSLVALSVKCTAISEELLGALNQLKVGDGLNNRWRSF